MMRAPPMRLKPPLEVCIHKFCPGYFMQISNIQISKFDILTHTDRKYNANPTI